jgi:hypothetical protein
MRERIDLERLDERAEDLSDWPEEEQAAREAVRPLASGIHVSRQNTQEKPVTVEVIGPVNEDSRGDQVLVKRGDEYFVVSSVDAMFSGFETLVFRSDEKGNVTNWGEVAGGRGMSREEAIADLAEQTA